MDISTIEEVVDTTYTTTRTGLLTEVKTPLTLKQVDSLYWLGRYAERVLSTLKVFMKVYDSQLDSNFDYADYCKKLDIYNGFTDIQDFCRRYAFDTFYPSSIVCSMTRAYDNAIMLRDTIGSEALAYIEMALRKMHEAEVSLHPMLKFQKVVDYIMAFYGTITDGIIDRNTRNIVLCGHGVERLDFYYRLGINIEKQQFESMRLSQALAYTDLPADSFEMEKICGQLWQDQSYLGTDDKMVLLQVVDSLFGVRS